MEISEIINNLIDCIKTSAVNDSIIGVPILSGNFTVIPVCKMTIGLAGLMSENTGKIIMKKNDVPLGGAGGGASLTPVGFLIIDGDNSKFIKTDGGNSWNECLENVLELFSH